MFLLRYGRHVCAAPKGVSVQSSINLGDTLLRIAREWKTVETWFLARMFILQSSIIPQIFEFLYCMVTIFIFNHMTEENQIHNLLLTEREGRTAEYWPEVGAVRTESIQKRPKANIPKYGSS